MHEGVDVECHTQCGRSGHLLLQGKGGREAAKGHEDEVVVPVVETAPAALLSRHHARQQLRRQRLIAEDCVAQPRRTAPQLALPLVNEVVRRQDQVAAAATAGDKREHGQSLPETDLYDRRPGIMEAVRGGRGGDIRGVAVDLVAQHASARAYVAVQPREAYVLLYQVLLDCLHAT